MDLWLNPSRSNEPTSKCDFCYQTGVPVKSLSCGSHFYCGVCEKFAPKFYKRSDYTCSRCPGPRRSQRQSLDLDLSPTTLNVRNVKKKQDFKEVTIAVEGGNIISFGGKLLAVKFKLHWLITTSYWASIIQQFISLISLPFQRCWHWSYVSCRPLWHMNGFKMINFRKLNLSLNMYTSPCSIFNLYLNFLFTLWTIKVCNRWQNKDLN